MMALISLHDNYCFNDCRPVRPCKNSDKHQHFCVCLPIGKIDNNNNNNSN